MLSRRCRCKTGAAFSFLHGFCRRPYICGMAEFNFLTCPADDSDDSGYFTMYVSGSVRNFIRENKGLRPDILIINPNDYNKYDHGLKDWMLPYKEQMRAYEEGLTVFIKEHDYELEIKVVLSENVEVYQWVLVASKFEVLAKKTKKPRKNPVNNGR